MKDFIGQDLNVGDRVVHGSVVSGGLAGPYFVTAFTPKMVKVARTMGASWSSCVPSSNLVKVSA